MHSIRNRLIFASSLGIVFFVTLVFGYGPGYGDNLFGVMGVSIKNLNNKEVSPQLSPSIMVTVEVTSKKKVTDNNVTNTSLVSPRVSPLISDNVSLGKVESLMSPTPSVMVTAKVTPIFYQTQNVSPSPQVSPSVSPIPITIIPTQTISNIGNVVISEIAWMGTIFSANDEWLELYNASNSDLSLDGWTLNSLTGTSPDPKITLSGSITAHSYVVLERTDDTTISDVQSFKIYRGALNDTGEFLELRDKNGNIIDSVSKAENTWFSGDKSSRSSMERINPFLSGNQASNWATNNGSVKNGHDSGGNVIFGTPGSANSSRGF